jgi:6-phosphogluconolactonase
MRQRIKFYETDEEMYIEAAQSICSLAWKSVTEHGNFSVALAGGKTPLPVYRSLLRRDFPWSQTDFFWGDERYVPKDDTRSNYLNIMEAFLSKSPVPDSNIHRIKTELEIKKAAEDYENEILKFKKDKKRDKIFDLVLLGMGEDGHTASIFSGNEAENESEKLVLAVSAPENIEPRIARITLTFPAIDSSEFVFFIIRGNNKRERLLRGDQCPALRVNSRKTIWFTA